MTKYSNSIEFAPLNQFFLLFIVTLKLIESNTYISYVTSFSWVNKKKDVTYEMYVFDSIILSVTKGANSIEFEYLVKSYFGEKKNTEI